MTTTEPMISVLLAPQDRADALLFDWLDLVHVPTAESRSRIGHRCSTFGRDELSPGTKIARSEAGRRVYRQGTRRTGALPAGAVTARTVRIRPAQSRAAACGQQLVVERLDPPDETCEVVLGGAPRLGGRPEPGRQVAVVKQAGDAVGE